MSFPGESLISAGVGGALSYAGAHAANKATKKLAREQMDFQERMSNTSYQRQLQDIRAAGLNPNLIYSAGGASSPSGATAQMQNELSPAVNSALDARRASAEIKNMEAVRKNLEAQNSNLLEQNENLKADRGRTRAETTLKEIEAMISKSRIYRAQLEEVFDKSKFGIFDQAMRHTMPHVNSGLSIFSKFMNLFKGRKNE